MKSVVNRWFTLPDKSFTWLRNTEATSEDDLSPVDSPEYTPVSLAGNVMNRILDDKAREIYKPAEGKLLDLVPKTMSKKIARANVQQAFVFDTVYRNLNKYNNPNLLCVGSYEDTASMSLQRMGYEIEDIDPMINYFLQEFYTKPSTVKNSYNIIFSTSVIEHDPDDESFVKCISGLLAPGGIAVITCDYKDGWKPGDAKPDVDARFYTKHDLEKRLLSCIPDCELVDSPQWDCPEPDFNYLGKYQYTFATFVVRKKIN
jgi:SAM-dependent methyltransferase